MEVRQARYFVAIADHQSMSRAATALHMTQPALSQAILQLERELNVVLFQRTSRGMRLTDHGAALVGPARELLESSRAAVAAVQLTDQEISGELTIACTPAFASAPLSQWVGIYRQKFPRVIIRLVPYVGVKSIDRVLDQHDADLVLAHVTNATGSHIVEIPAGEEELVLVVPADADPFEVGIVNLSELADQPLVLSPPHTSMHQSVTEAFEALGIAPRVGVETQFMDSFIPLAAEGAGWAIVPRNHADLAKTSKIRVHSLDPAPRRSRSMYHLRQGLPLAAIHFLRLMTVLSNDRHEGA